MVKRQLQAAFIVCGVSGIIALLGLASAASPQALRLAALISGQIASAQVPAELLRYQVVPAQSEARYRIREQLAGFDLPNDAVGATRAVEGVIVLDAQGRIVPDASRLTVDLRTLQSDRDRRDNYVRRNTLHTERYPTTVFVPTEARGLPFPLPERGSATFELVGDLTVRGVTRRVIWNAMADFRGQDIQVQATTAFRFEEFDLTIPRVASVLSVDNNIRLEADLLLRRSS
jgi:polyisoprenoid-binding protein YceI